MRSFTHLEVHSHYSLLSGTASVEALAERAVADGMTHLALTDTNCMYGAVAFDTACRVAGIEPILGLTIVVNASTISPSQAAVTLAGRPDLVAECGDNPARLVLLAKNQKGYRSLCRLASTLRERPRRKGIAHAGIGWEALKANRNGLVCLSGGRSGWLERLLRSGRGNAAHRYAGQLAGIFGENAFLSLTLRGQKDAAIAGEVTRLGSRLGMPVVAVQPVYCLQAEDTERLRLMAAIDRNCLLKDIHLDSQADGGALAEGPVWLSSDQVRQRFATFPQAVQAVGEVVSRCRPALPHDDAIWPAVELQKNKSAAETLSDMAQEGLVRRFGDVTDTRADLNVRLEKELSTINRHGYAPLFLVVADITRYARQESVPYGTRGSVANSLVAFCIGITTIDPIAHDLLFERFLSPDRTDPPDIDLNFCSRRRDEILEYLREEYGEDRVALVSTINTMGRRSAVRETAKAFGLDEREIRRLMATLPRAWLTRWHGRRESQTDADVVNSITNRQWRKVVEAALVLVGQPHHLGLHPGGAVVTPGPVTDFFPVQWTPKGFHATQFGQEHLKTLGLPKIDILGVRALTVLATSEKLVQKHYDAAFSVDAIPVPDPQAGHDGDATTGDQLERAETIGVFQCESAGARLTQRKLKTRTTFDLAVANAFYKPAPALGGMARAFVRRYRGEEPMVRLHPALVPILGRTKGVILFQEQVLRVTREVAQLSWAEAHALRYGKLGAEELELTRQRFMDGCQQPGSGPGSSGLTQQQASTLWEQVTAFAGFSLNQGHATAYADLSYRMAYTKAHWPAAFLCARLADWGGFHHQAIYIAEAQRLGIKVKPPHVNHSRRKFTLQALEGIGHDAEHTAGSAVLWMGLGQVRDLRQRSLLHIAREREKGRFRNLRELMRRVPLQSKEITHLIQCGALDGLGENRASLLAEAEAVHASGSASQLAFSFAQPAQPADTADKRIAWERQVLGQPISVHPLAVVAARLPRHTALRSLPEKPLGNATVAGVPLPGWTGGRGFFLGDGDSFITVDNGSTAAPPAWQPVLIRGEWRTDNWGTFWMRAVSITRVS